MGRVLVFENKDSVAFGANRLLNGGCRLFQREPNAAVNIGGGLSYQTIDRFMTGYNAGGTVTQQTQRSTFTPPGVNVTHSLDYVLDVNGTGGNVIFQQFVEDIHAFDLASQAVSSGLWVYSESATNFRLEHGTSTVANSFSGKNTLASFDFTIPLNQWYEIKLENVLYDSNALNGAFIYGYFSDFTDTGIKHHYATGMRLHEGKVLRPFNHFANASLTEEIRINQRYYEKSYPLDSSNGSTGSAGRGEGMAIPTFTAAGTFNRMHVYNAKFLVEKRSQPSVRIWNHRGNVLENYVSTYNGDTNDTIVTSSIGAALRGIEGYLRRPGDIDFSASNNYLFHWLVDDEIGL